MPTRAAFITINGAKYPVLHDEALPRGVRAYERNTRPTQASDPVRTREAIWKVAGPIGASREGDDGFLGVDYAEHQDTRWPDLITGQAEDNILTLSASDPATNDTTLPLALPFGLSGAQIGNVSHIEEDRGILCFARGTPLSIVDPSNMTLIETENLSAAIEGMAVWKNQLHVGLGNGAEMMNMTSISAAGGTLAAITSVRAKALARGSNIFWLVKADASGTEENYIMFAAGTVTSATLGTPFQVGDDKINATGLATIGPLTVVGSEIGAFSFTDEGKSTPVVKSVEKHRDVDNARSMTEAFGWLYVTTALGLVAIKPGVEENPVGPGDIAGYEGPAGRPTAVMFHKSSLWLAEQVGADVYIWRGIFGPETRDTGIPLWFPWDKYDASSCAAFGATGERAGAVLIAADGTEARWYDLPLRSREIADSTYRYRTGNGLWYGTTMMRQNMLHKYTRYWSFITENCDPGKTWQLACSSDEGAFVDVGDPISTNGHHFVRPVDGNGVPLAEGAGVDFHTLKPRLASTNTSDTAPPQIRGPLTLVYDERPDTVLDVRVRVALTTKTRATMIDALEELANHDAIAPIKISLPDELTPRYGFVTAVQLEEIGGDGAQAARVDMTLWAVGD
jgi:hypothetical protein